MTSQSKPSSQRSTPVVSASVFFDRVLPRMFASGAAHAHSKGRVVFAVGGDDGGRWCITFGCHPRVDHAPEDFNGDLKVTMSGGTFPQFLDGSLDVMGAVRTGEMSLEGDLTLLSALATMWNAPVSALALRMDPKRTDGAANR